MHINNSTGLIQSIPSIPHFREGGSVDDRQGRQCYITGHWENGQNGEGYIAQRGCGCIRFAQRMDTTALSPTPHGGAKAVR